MLARYKNKVKHSNFGSQGCPLRTIHVNPASVSSISKFLLSLTILLSISKSGFGSCVRSLTVIKGAQAEIQLVEKTRNGDLYDTVLLE